MLLFRDQSTYYKFNIAKTRRETVAKVQKLGA